MDELQAALHDFDEALTRKQYRDRVDASANRMQSILAKFFRSQGSQFIRGLKKRAAMHFESATSVNHFADVGDFNEALTPFRPTDPWMNYARHQNAVLKEAISETDWILIWMEVTDATKGPLSDAVDALIANVLKLGGLAQVATLGMKIKFDLDNPRAVKFLTDYGANLVKGINDETKSQLQTLLGQSADEGWSLQKTENEIAAKFGQFADGNAIENIQSRAALIAQTETGNAYEEGNYEVGQSLVDAGLTVEKSWLVNGEGCEDICQPNADAGWIDFEDEFPSGDQRPLGHPNCHCDMLTRVVSGDDEE